jgi:hypothetical protein
MERKILTEQLKKLGASDRFDVLYGPQKTNIENQLGCKILTVPFDQLGNLPENLEYFMVTDSQQGMSYLAIFQPVH